MKKMETIQSRLGFRAEAIIALLGAGLLLVLSGCFSPWSGDEGTLTINLGGGLSRAVWDITTDNVNYEHEVILDGPNGTISQTFKPGTTNATIQLAPGKYTITVRAMGGHSSLFTGEYYDAYPNFPDPMLKALGYAEVTIKAGQASSASVTMVTATEVFNADQLGTALGFANDTGSGLEEYILLANDIVVSSPLYFSSGTVTLIADKSVWLSRVKTGFNTDSSGALINCESGTLILGSPAMKGSLTIDGGGDSQNMMMGTIINADGNDGALVEMNDGVTLTNNYDYSAGGGAVTLTNGAGFNMKGGTINQNFCVGSSNSGGGAINSNNGTFSMTGGLIADNTAEVGNGGAVYLGNESSFKMEGGIISGNGAAMGNGGGVYVDSSSTFVMNNNTAITGGNAADYGGGVYVDGSFTMNDNSMVSDNNAVYYGGGVYVGNGAFTMQGGKVVGTFNSQTTEGDPITVIEKYPNTVTPPGLGAALYTMYGATVQYYTYDSVSQSWIYKDFDSYISNGNDSYLNTSIQGGDYSLK